MKSRKSLKVPSDATINYWYKSALNYIKKFPISSQAQLNKLADDFSLYAARDFWGYMGPVPNTKLKATKEIILDKLQKSKIVKSQVGIGNALLGSL